MALSRTQHFSGFRAVAEAGAAPVKSKPTTDPEKQVADDLAIESLVREQYKVYLFERILLRCKEIPDSFRTEKLNGIASRALSTTVMMTTWRIERSAGPGLWKTLMLEVQEMP